MRLLSLSTVTSIVLVMNAAASSGCGSTRLTTSTATSTIVAAIADHEATVRVDGVSQSSETDAVVAANIMTTDMRLIFRRYDTGWKWEGVEGINGSRIDSAPAIEAIQKKSRRGRAVAWAQPLVDKYRETADTIKHLHSNMNRKVEEPLDEAGWYERHKFWISVLESQKSDPQKAAILKRISVPTDAWGNLIAWTLNDAKRTGFVVSGGPDGKLQTADDLACMFVGDKHWDSSYQKVLWDYGYSWVAPEGTDDALVDFVAPKIEGATVTYVKFVK